MIRIGYVGVNTVLPTASRTLRLTNYSENRMLEISRDNILALEEILKWNLCHKIYLFRITSKLIPFGSNSVNSGSWKSAFKGDFQRIGLFIQSQGMRISMHPGQYTILNTPNDKYFDNTIRDLEYHNTIFNLMGLNSSHKIVLHGGGAYNDKDKYSALLIQRISELETSIRNRIVLENDDKVFTADDILKICRQACIPGVLDVFHHHILTSLPQMSLCEILDCFQDTWLGERQEIHYSNQEPAKFKGCHSQTININEFGQFYNSVKDLELDIMLEVKDKQASVLTLRKAFPDLQ
jgi:UV DNA damage endonuclease